MLQFFLAGTPRLPHFGGDIFLTTREYMSSKMAHAVIQIEKMDNEDALRLLFGSSAFPSEGSSERELAPFIRAQEIVQELDCLPLAVDLARAYIEQTQTSFEYYLTQFTMRHEALLSYHHDDVLDQYKHSVKTVWELSLKQVQQKSPAAAQILEACS